MHGKWCQEIGFIPYSLPTHWITIGKSINLRYLGFSFRKMLIIGSQMDTKVYPHFQLARMPAQHPTNRSLDNWKSSSSESHWFPSPTLRLKIFKPSLHSEMFIMLRKSVDSYVLYPESPYILYLDRHISNTMIKFKHLFEKLDVRKHTHFIHFQEKYYYSCWTTGVCSRWPLVFWE